MQLQQGKQIAKSSLLRKCGLLAYTSPTFLKNCWIKKLFRCLRLVTGNSAVSFAPQMWAARPHLGSIFEKLLHQKTFSLPAARFLQPI